MKEQLFKKYKIIQAIRNIEQVGAIFDFENELKHNKELDITKLKKGKDYITDLGIAIDAKGARPQPIANFTDKGIKKLLKTSESMRQTVRDEWAQITSF